MFLSSIIRPIVNFLWGTICSSSSSVSVRTSFPSSKFPALIWNWWKNLSYVSVGLLSLGAGLGLGIGFFLWIVGSRYRASSNSNSSNSRSNSLSNAVTEAGYFNFDYSFFYNGIDSLIILVRVLNGLYYDSYDSKLSFFFTLGCLRGSSTAVILTLLMLWDTCLPFCFLIWAIFLSYAFLFERILHLLLQVIHWSIVIDNELYTIIRNMKKMLTHPIV